MSHEYRIVEEIGVFPAHKDFLQVITRMPLFGIIKGEKKDAELQNIVAEQKLRTQRILGELISEGQSNGSIAGQGDRPSNVPVGNISTLENIGLNRKQSSTFQRIASIPQERW